MPRAIGVLRGGSREVPHVTVGPRSLDGAVIAHLAEPRRQGTDDQFIPEAHPGDGLHEVSDGFQHVGSLSDK